MTYDELTATLPKNLADAFIVSPGYIGGDSLDLEAFIEEKQITVTVENYRTVAQQFRAWYREHAPDEYHDPPTEAEMMAWGWGGFRPRPEGSKPAGRPDLGKVSISITIDADLLGWIDEQPGKRSTAINRLLRNAKA